MRQPPAGVEVHVSRPNAQGVRVDDRGFVVLSEWDIDRLATAVVNKMRESGLQPVSGDGAYVPVHRNAPQTPMSEY